MKITRLPATVIVEAAIFIVFGAFAALAALRLPALGIVAVWLLTAGCGLLLRNRLGWWLAVGCNAISVAICVVGLAVALLVALQAALATAQTTPTPTRTELAFGVGVIVLYCLMAATSLMTLCDRTVRAIYFVPHKNS